MQELTYDDLKKVCHLPERQAAKTLGVSLSHLQTCIYALKVRHWPHRQIASLHTLAKLIEEVHRLGGLEDEEKEAHLLIVKQNQDAFARDLRHQLPKELLNLRDVLWKRRHHLTSKTTRLFAFKPRKRRVITPGSAACKQVHAVTVGAECATTDWDSNQSEKSEDGRAASVEYEGMLKSSDTAGLSQERVDMLDTQTAYGHEACDLGILDSLLMSDLWDPYASPAHPTHPQTTITASVPHIEVSGRQDTSGTPEPPCKKLPMTQSCSTLPTKQSHSKLPSRKLYSHLSDSPQAMEVSMLHPYQPETPFPSKATPHVLQHPNHQSMQDDQLAYIDGTTSHAPAIRLAQPAYAQLQSSNEPLSHHTTENTSVGSDPSFQARPTAMNTGSREAPHHHHSYKNSQPVPKFRSVSLPDMPAPRHTRTQFLTETPCFTFPGLQLQAGCMPPPGLNGRPKHFLSRSRSQPSLQAAAPMQMDTGPLSQLWYGDFMLQDVDSLFDTCQTGINQALRETSQSPSLHAPCGYRRQVHSDNGSLSHYSLPVAPPRFLHSDASMYDLQQFDEPEELDCNADDTSTMHPYAQAACPHDETMLPAYNLDEDACDGPKKASALPFSGNHNGEW